MVCATAADAVARQRKTAHRNFVFIIMLLIAPLLCKGGGNAFGIDAPHVVIGVVRQPDGVQTELDHASTVTGELLHHLFLFQLRTDLGDRESGRADPDETITKGEISVGIRKSEIYCR